MGVAEEVRREDMSRGDDCTLSYTECYTPFTHTLLEYTKKSEHTLYSEGWLSVAWYKQELISTKILPVICTNNVRKRRAYESLLLWKSNKRLKVKLSRYRPGQAIGVPGS